ncbi:MAG: hypothetical protein JWN40_4323, partial [Phycisphaerales bacterium]|nr:hypothetical protein [Phycisphaerales bacterium]
MPAATVASATATTVSEKNLTANRQNARKSTGPRTPAGKRTAAQNALRHGGFAADTLLPDEDHTAFVHFRHAFIQSLNPQNMPQLFLADRAVSLAWRLQRLQQADSVLYQFARDDYHRRFLRIRQDYRARAAHNPDEINTIHPELRPLFESDDDDPAASAAPAPILLALSFERTATPAGAPRANGPTPPGAPDSPFDRLARAEQRLHAMYHRTLRELTALQTRREKRSQNPDHHP